MNARKPLGQVRLGTGATSIYAPPTVPPNTMGQVVALWIANADTVARAVTLRVGAGSLTAANGLFEAVSVAANTTYFIESNEIVCLVPAGSHLEGLCDVADKVTVSAFGDEIT